MALTRPRYSQIYDTDYKQSVRVATTADVGNLLATGNMTNTVDGVTLVLADRILVKDQSDAKQNGIYRVLTVGTGSDGTWGRTLDANANDKITAGMTTVVSEGDVNISKTFRLATPDPIVIGTTELSFVNPFTSGSAAGADTNIQFNDGGTTGATANLTFNKSTNTLTVGNSLITTNLIGNANITVTGSLLPSANITYDLGSPTQRWRDGWFSGTTIYIGTESMSVSESGTWAFTSGGATVELGAEAVFNPPNANISGNVTATNYLFANGTPLMTIVNTMISDANTNMQGHVAEQISTANTNLKGYTDNLVSTANINLKGYVDLANTIQSNQISGANSAITTANTNLKGYTDNLVSTANINLKGYVDGEISTTSSAITTANTNMKGYVDSGLSSLNKINANGSNVTVTASYVNVAVNSANIAAFSSTGILTTGNVDAASVNATNLYGAIWTAAQPNITSLGTLSGLTMGGALAMGTNKITGLDTPIASTDAANKQYVDEVAAGLKAAPAVEAATTTNLTANYNNGNLGVGATLTATSNGAFPNIDGVAITSTTTGENGVLVKNQSTSAQNGRYNLTQVGDGSNPWILTRCGVCDEADEIPGSYVFVKAGSTLASTGWVAYVAEPSTFVVGTNNITYFQFSGAGTYTAGTGLTLAGTQFSVDAVQTQITQVGTLGNLTVSGNVTASYLIGNGSQLTGLPAGYTDTDVANYLPNHTGNVGASSVNATNLFGTILTAAQTSITSVGTLTSLAVSGVSSFAAGSAAAPSIARTGNTNTGMFFPAADTIAFSEGGSEAMRIDSSGRVGIGQTSVIGKLDVRASGTGKANGLIVRNSADNSTYIGLTATSFSSADITASSISDFAVDMKFWTDEGGGAGTQERMRITSTGNVGIGNTNPLRTLSVNGSAGITGNVVLSGSNAAPNAAVTIRGYTGGTSNSVIANYQKSLVIGGDYNQPYNSGNAAILHIADYSNDGGDNVYPIYCEDENNGVDFYLYSGNNTVGTDKIAYFGGALRINAGNQSTAIVNSGTNGVGNIGASGQGFNTVFAKATSAQYADLAEVYVGDKNYIPGTVVVFGGIQEVTVSLTSHDPSVAGVVSTNPAYLMNDSVEGVAVALQGRVPCRVLGPVVKGDRVVTSDVRGVAERLDMTKYQPGCIIGKALGSVPDGEIATIEVVVGRN